jgi:hypothetical protein
MEWSGGMAAPFLTTLHDHIKQVGSRRIIGQLVIVAETGIISRGDLSRSWP